MQLTLNGEPREIDAATVAELVQALDLGNQPVAVEVNQQLVPKARHADTPLHHGDTLEVVTLVGGG